MNRDEWDKMTPEQRNKLIHEKVMGKPVYCTGKAITTWRKNPSRIQGEFFEYATWSCTYCGETGSSIAPEQHEELGAAKIPAYTEDMNAAWQIVEKMTARMTWQNPNFKWRGPIYKPEYEYMTQDGYPLDTTCWYVYLEMDGLRQWICASKAIDAICLAGLKANEQQEVLSENNPP